MSKDFEIVSASDIPARKTRGNHPTPASLALADGQTIFIVGRRASDVFRSPNSYLSRRGFRIHQRTGERNGVAGQYIWATKGEPNEPLS